ncbi:MAG: hypothetical protein PHW77_07685 [Eubacteriales bacterium]|nr:hypothetical protein [Eubacteriales bacterium]
MKKLFTVILALALVFSCFAVFALTSAAEGEDEITVVDLTFESAVAGECVEFLRGGAADNSVLYNGETLAGSSLSDHDTLGIVLIQNTRCTEAGVYPLYSYILELSEKADITEIKIATYEYYNAMIGLPKDNKVAVEYSDNGTDFTFAGDYTIDGEAEASETAANEYVLDLGKTITGTYIKLTFAFGDSPHTTDGKIIWEWHGFTELGVTAEPASGAIDLSEDESSVAVDESSEEPASSAAEVSDETSDEASVQTSAETSEETPKTGDSGIVALAVIAVIALAGVAVIKRK